MPPTLRTPEHDREEAALSLAAWSQVISDIGRLLPLAEVSLEDKRLLICDLKTATANATACVNQMQASDIEARAMVDTLRKKWGWLL